MYIKVTPSGVFVGNPPTKDREKKEEYTVSAKCGFDSNPTNGTTNLEASQPEISNTNRRNSSRYPQSQQTLVYLLNPSLFHGPLSMFPNVRRGRSLIRRKRKIHHRLTFSVERGLPSRKVRRERERLAETEFGLDLKNDQRTVI